MIGIQIQRLSHPNANTQAELPGLAVSHKVCPPQSKRSLLNPLCVDGIQDCR